MEEASSMIQSTNQPTNPERRPSPGHSSDITVINPFRKLLPVPGIATYGTWEPHTWQHDGTPDHGLRLIPEEAPWHGLFAALDKIGKDLSDRPVTLTEEANAIVACCWRYGSYAHVLTSGESYPAFKTNPELSRIRNSEMKRINLEFSSGLAVWLEDSRTDPGKVHRRVRAALSTLPMPWLRKEGALWPPFGEVKARVWAQGLEDVAATLPDAMRRIPKPSSVREEANAVVNWAYRNMKGGYLEDLHAGKASQGGNLPGYQRLYASEVNAICRSTADRIGIHLFVAASADEQVKRIHHLVMQRPSDWSVTDETAPVTYAGVPDPLSAASRLADLAVRCPLVYGDSELGEVQDQTPVAPPVR